MADKLVSVRGTVVKVSTVRPLVVQMSFDCEKCKSTIIRVLPDGKYSPPTICNLNGCKSRTFHPIRSSAKGIDFQKIRQALYFFLLLWGHLACLHFILFYILSSSNLLPIFCLCFIQDTGVTKVWRSWRRAGSSNSGMWTNWRSCWCMHPWRCGDCYWNHKNH